MSADRVRASFDNLPRLQDYIKRDKESYKTEFLCTYQYLESIFGNYELTIRRYDRAVAERVLFVAQVAHCYSDLIKDFPAKIIEVLKRNASILDGEMRLAFCKALILLRNKGLVDAMNILELFFGLFKVQDRALRKVIFSYIVQDIKKTPRDTASTGKLQRFLLGKMCDSSECAAKKSLNIMIALYHRGVWKDAKTVNFIEKALYSKFNKILVIASNFFLGEKPKGSADTENGGDSSDDSAADEDVLEKKRNIKLSKKNQHVRQLEFSQKVGKKTKKKERRLKRAVANMKRIKKSGEATAVCNFSAIHLLNDPQDTAERLYSRVASNSLDFNTRVLLLDLISRLIGVHKLQVLPFYSYIQRYIHMRQDKVTNILMFAAQASHELVPDEVMQPLVRAIADEFISDKSSENAIVVGLNTVTEICARLGTACSIAMTPDLLSDLVIYSKSRDNAIRAAAHRLINLFREKCMQMLPKKEQGRPTEEQMEQLEDKGGFGVSAALKFVQGAEILKTEMELQDRKSKRENGESDSDDDDELMSDLESDDMECDDDQQSTKLIPLSLTKEEAQSRALNILTSRILTSDDIHKIKQEQLRRKAAFYKRSIRKRNVIEDDDNQKLDHLDIEALKERSGELVNMSDITKLVRKPKSDKQERLQSIIEGRTDKSQFGLKVNRANPMASSTNREKRKLKDVGMVRHKMLHKVMKKSFKQKQINGRKRNKKAYKLMKH